MTHTPLTRWKDPAVVTGGDVFMFDGPSMREIARVAADFKQAIYNVGLNICKEFLDINGIAHAKYHTGVVPHSFNKWQATGLQCQDKVWVDLAKCSTPRFVKSRNWSWPGYKVDKTPAGVVAHETGHYVVWCMRQDYSMGMNTFAKDFDAHPLIDWPKIMRGKPVSGYEPTSEEAFAETMRLFILNPDLLRAGWPGRYNFLVDAIGMKPAHSHTWREVFSHAPAHIIEQAEKIKRSKREVEIVL